jgi:hypothetical protein
VRRPPRSCRSWVVLLAAQCGLAACDGSVVQPCSGAAQGTFVVGLTRTAASCPGNSKLDATYLPSTSVTITVAFDDSGDGATICTGRHEASPLTGTHAGDAVSVSTPLPLPTGGAVLAGCLSSCLVATLQEVTGVLVRDPASGRATGLDGALVETDTLPAGAAAGTCGICTLPCTATWTLGPPPP